jgi:hypothetical protein
VLCEVLKSHISSDLDHKNMEERKNARKGRESPMNAHNKNKKTRKKEKSCM